jgi:hypothetical protein
VQSDGLPHQVHQRLDVPEYDLAKDRKHINRSGERFDGHRVSVAFNLADHFAGHPCNGKGSLRATQAFPSDGAYLDGGPILRDV